MFRKQPIAASIALEGTLNGIEQQLSIDEQELRASLAGVLVHPDATAEEKAEAGRYLKQLGESH